MQYDKRLHVFDGFFHFLFWVIGIKATVPGVSHSHERLCVSYCQKPRSSALFRAPQLKPFNWGFTSNNQKQHENLRDPKERGEDHSRE